jgi:isopenicillin N synthase-like dioxygenase
VVDVPLVDIGPWRQTSGPARSALASTVDEALRRSGFLLVAGHNISGELREQIRQSARRFFALSDDVKAPYRAPVGGRGWLPIGGEANAYYGQIPDATRSDLKESLTFGRSFETGDPELDAAWFAPNVWPSETPELRVLCEQYSAEVRELYDVVLEVFAVALGLDEGWFVARSRRSPHTFNINRYPPRTQTGRPKDGQYRVAPHTDWGMLTILDRQPGYGGLQIQMLNGHWIDAPYEPDAFTVNVADLLSRWTGGRWRSTRHRVLPPPAAAPAEELVSLIHFLEVDPDAVVAPIAGDRSLAPVTAGVYLAARTAAATVA